MVMRAIQGRLQAMYTATGARRRKATGPVLSTVSTAAAGPNGFHLPVVSSKPWTTLTIANAAARATSAASGCASTQRTMRSGSGKRIDAR
jgi:hypothetical protein